MEALALRLAAPHVLKAVFSQPPVEPAPLTDQGKVAVWRQHPRDLGGMQSSPRLRDQVEEAVGVGEMSGLAALESDPTLRVEANPRYRLFNCFGGGVDAPHPGCGKLTGEEEHPIAVVAFDLEYALRPGGNMQDGGGEGGERRRGHRPMI